MKPVAKIERIAKDKIFVVKNIDHAWTGRAAEQANRFVARAVEMDIGRIQRNGENRPAAPFKGYFAGSVLPYRGRASPLGDIDDFLEEMALRQGLSTRRDFADVGIGLLLVGKIQVAAQGAHTFPFAELQSGHVVDDVAFDDRNPLLCLQLIVGRRAKIKMLAEG